MSMEQRKDSFELWLASMDTYLDQLRASVPDDLTLDFSLESLKPLQVWLLQHYPDLDAAKADMAGTINDAGVYVGETIRKTAGRGKWRLDDTQGSAFEGLPILVDFRDGAPVCPVTLVSASTDRRNPDYLFNVASHLTSLDA